MTRKENPLEELEKAYAQWESLYLQGGSDPFYADGVNLNLVRNHILYFKRQIEETQPLYKNSDGCGARCFAGVQCASLIILPAYHRPQAATPVLLPGFVAHLFSSGSVLRTCNRVMAHRPTGSTQTDRIRLPYAAPEASRRAFFVKEL